jgi:hypothetical protein
MAQGPLRVSKEGTQEFGQAHGVGGAAGRQNSRPADPIRPIAGTTDVPTPMASGAFSIHADPTVQQAGTPYPVA